MNYGLLWKEVVFNRKAMDIVNKATNAELTWHQGKRDESFRGEGRVLGTWEHLRIATDD